MKEKYCFRLEEIQMPFKIINFLNQIPYKIINVLKFYEFVSPTKTFQMFALNPLTTRLNFCCTLVEIRLISDIIVIS